MDAPPVQYARTSDELSIAFTDSGEGVPLIKLPMQFNHVQLAWQTGPPEGGQPAWLTALSRRFRLITYDARCQGLSTRGRPASDWLEGELIDLSAVADGLGLDRFVLYAAFGRTHTGVHYAVRHSDRVLALVLQGSIISGAQGLNVSAASLAERDWDFFLRSQVPVGAPSDTSQQILAYLSASMTQGDWLHCIHTFAQSDIENALGLVRTPTLVLYPRQTPYATEEDSVTAAAAIPGARLVVTDDSNEWGTATLEAMTTFVRGLSPGLPRSAPELSGREMEVLRLLAAGRSNQQIADELVISLNTVRRHVSNIFDKAGVANRAQAAVYAKDHGLA